MNNITGGNDKLKINQILNYVNISNIIINKLMKIKQKKIKNN